MFRVLIAMCVAAIAVLLVVLGLVVTGHAQAPRAPERSSVLEQRLRDLHDHRDWLEDQLAAAKAINAGLQAQLTAATAELATCRDAK